MFKIRTALKYVQNVDVADLVNITRARECGFGICSVEKKMIHKIGVKYYILPEDQRIFNILKDIANEIDETILM